MNSSTKNEPGAGDSTKSQFGEYAETSRHQKVWKDWGARLVLSVLFLLLTVTCAWISWWQNMELVTAAEPSGRELPNLALFALKATMTARHSSVMLALVLLAAAAVIATLPIKRRYVAAFIICVALITVLPGVIALWARGQF